MESIFLPVLTTPLLGGIRKALPDMGYWWDPPLAYNAGLFSYPDWRKFVKEKVEPPERTYIFGDSGGFSLIANPDEKFDPIDVLLWQAEHVNVGAILDRPPRRVKRRDWQDCLRFTIDNVRRALPYYERSLEQGGKFRWWGVLHGNSEAEAYEWHGAITNAYPFNRAGEGWAVYPGPQAEPRTVARAMRVLQQLGIKRAHFLACTGQDVIATILALGPLAGLEFVTFDSLSHAIASYNRWWFTTDATLGGRMGVSDARSSSKRKIMKGVDYVFENVRCLNDAPEKFVAECPCDVCRWAREHTPAQIAGPAAGNWRDGIISLHNICIQSRCIARQTEEARKDPEKFLQIALDPYTAASAFRIFYGQESERPAATGSNLGLLRGLKK